MSGRICLYFTKKSFCKSFQKLFLQCLDEDEMSTILRTKLNIWELKTRIVKNPPLWLLSVFLTFNPHLWTIGHAWTESPLFKKKRFCMLRKLLQQAEIIIIMFKLQTIHHLVIQSRLNTQLIFFEKILPRTLHLLRHVTVFNIAKSVGHGLLGMTIYIMPELGTQRVHFNGLLKSHRLHRAAQWHFLNMAQE